MSDALRHPQSLHRTRNPLTRRTPADVRAFTLASGAGRIAIGVGLALAPRLALKGLGFNDHSAATVAIARIAGGRDIALGAATLLAMDDPERLRSTHIANAAVDGGDAAAFAAALASGDEDVRDAGLRGVAAGAAAAAAGAWVAWRLG